MLYYSTVSLSSEQGRISLADVTSGPPGVGKTLTAESVAIRANKPLFAVGVTDVGVDPEKVQVNLERMFELAGTWEAVLLMQVDYPTPELICTHTTIQ